MSLFCYRILTLFVETAILNDISIMSYNNVSSHITNHDQLLDELHYLKNLNFSLRNLVSFNA